MKDQINLALMILLPILPALLLFAGFHSSGTGEGTFLGFKVKLSGPAVLYFVIFLLVFLKINVWHPARLWQLDGQVVDQNGNPIGIDPKDFSLISPPDKSSGNQGEFRITFAVDGDQFPRLEINSPHLNLAKQYEPVSIPLKPDGKLVVQDRDGFLTIKSIVLKDTTASPGPDKASSYPQGAAASSHTSANLGAYNPNQGVAPAPIPVSQEPPLERKQ